MVEIVSLGWFLTITLLLDCIYCWTEINPRKLLLSLQSRLALSQCYNLMGKWNLNPLCSPEPEWPEVAEGVELLLLPRTWESNRIFVAGSKKQPHAWDFMKLKYIVKSTHSGWSHACQESKSQKPPLDPSDHLSCNPSYSIFPEEVSSAFWVGNPKGAYAAENIYACLRNQWYPRCSLLHKRAACFSMLKHFLQLYQ